VATREIPAYTLAGGVPAQPIERKARIEVVR
jgi:acetyltransferase-like isoleucine patch superfamily enzyme